MIKVCHDKVLDWDDQVKATVLALKEHTTNASKNPISLADYTRFPSGPDMGAAVLLTGKRWKRGRTIRIGFMDGSPYLKNQVKEWGSKWLNKANLNFSWTSNWRDAEIRITFTRGGSWSYIGTDNLVVSKTSPTMQFGWLTDQSSEDEIKSVVMHEFGHMLGLGHEHQHPRGNINWNKPRVYDYYKRTDGWDKAQVDAQVFALYSLTQTNYSAYDKDSIMHYAIPKELLLDPSDAVGWNVKRSALDNSFIEAIY